MSTSLFVRRHINDLSRTSLFTSREMLQYGSRAAVDSILYKLVKSGVIHRVARGVFRKLSLDRSPPTVFEVARAKAAAFSRKIFPFHDVAAYELGMSENLPTVETCQETGKAVFYTNGSRTSFMYGGIEIEFKSASPRKRNLIDDRVGKYLKALWFLGPGCFEHDQFMALKFDRIEMRALRAQLSLMPQWIQSFFPNRRSKYRDLELYGAPIYDREESLWKRIARILQSGNGRSVIYY